jgi:hypothetical protein
MGGEDPSRLADRLRPPGLPGRPEGLDAIAVPLQLEDVDGEGKNQTADDDAYVEEELGGNLGGESPDAVVGGAIEAVGVGVPGLGEVVEEVPEGGGHRPLAIGIRRVIRIGMGEVGKAERVFNP